MTEHGLQHSKIRRKAERRGGNRTTEASAGGRQTYAIAPGSLASALNRLAETGGVQLIYDSALTQRLKTQGPSGAYTPREALQKLLDGSGLNARPSGKDAYTIETAARTEPPSQSGEATALGKVTVTGKAAYDSTDPYNADYTRPQRDRRHQDRHADHGDTDVDRGGAQGGYTRPAGHPTGRCRQERQRCVPGDYFGRFLREIHDSRLQHQVRSWRSTI
jgi:hypothetical protein